VARSALLLRATEASCWAARRSRGAVRVSRLASQHRSCVGLPGLVRRPNQVPASTRAGGSDRLSPTQATWPSGRIGKGRVAGARVRSSSRSTIRMCPSSSGRSRRRPSRRCGCFDLGLVADIGLGDQRVLDASHPAKRCRPPCGPRWTRAMCPVRRTARWSRTSIARACSPPDRDPSSSGCSRPLDHRAGPRRARAPPPAVFPAGPPPAITTACSCMPMALLPFVAYEAHPRA
jgi:hypothetical protein